MLERSLIKCKGDVEAAKLLITNDVNSGKPASLGGESQVNPIQSAIDEEAENVGNFRTKLFENFNKKCLNNQGLSVITKLSEKCSPVKRTFSTANSHSPVQKAKKFKKGKNRYSFYCITLIIKFIFS